MFLFRFLFLLCLFSFFHGCVGGGGGSGDNNSSGDKEVELFDVACEQELFLGNNVVDTISSEYGEMSTNGICPEGSLPSESVLICGESGEFDRQVQCVPDYVEKGFNCNGELIDFEETSMALKFRVLGDDDLSNPASGGVSLSNQVMIPVVDWHYNTSSDESISANYIDRTSSGSISDYGDFFDEAFPRELDIYIDWGDGTCSHVKHGSTFDESLLTKDFTASKNSLSLGDDGLRYATVRITGSMGFLSPFIHEEVYFNSSDPETRMHEADRFTASISEVIELGSLDWFSFFQSFSETGLNKFQHSFSDWSQVRDTSWMFSATCYSNNLYLKTDCAKIDFDFSDLDFKNIKYADGMFYQLIANSVILSGQNFDQLESSYALFNYGTIRTVDVSNLILPKLTEGSSFFASFNVYMKSSDPDLISFFDTNEDGEVSLDEYESEIFLDGIDFSGDERSLALKSFFSHTTHVNKIQPSNWSGLEGLISINLQSFLRGVKNITTVLSDFNFLKVNNIDSFFYETILSDDELIIGEFTPPNIERMSSVFRDSNLGDYSFCESWDTSNVLWMRDMFNGVDTNQTIDLSGWDTSNVTDMRNFFNDIGDTTFNLGYWNMNSVTRSNSILGSGLSDGDTLETLHVYCHSDGDENIVGTILDNLNSPNADDSNPADDMTINCKGTASP